MKGNEEQNTLGHVHGSRDTQLTDSEVDTFLTERVPIDEAAAERVEQLFQKKLAESRVRVQPRPSCPCVGPNGEFYPWG